VYSCGVCFALAAARSVRVAAAAGSCAARRAGGRMVARAAVAVA
jgi:hypothetical protein